MNHKTKKFTALCWLLSISSLQLVADQTKSHNSWIGRSYGSNAPQELSANRQAWSSHSKGQIFGAINTAISYQRSFNQDKNGIGSYALWSGNNSMSLGDNSTAAGNGKYDWDVFQMGLGPAKGSATLSLNPTVYQTGITLYGVLGNNEMERGWFTKVQMPVGMISIDPGMTVAGNLTPQPYYASAAQGFTFYPNILDNDVPTAIPTGKNAAQLARNAYSAPYQSVEHALSGNNPYVGIVRESAYSSLPRHQIDALQYGKVAGLQKSNAHGLGIGDVQCAVGYNVYATEKHHLGIALRGLVPTGNKPTAQYMLEPIFGYGGHWGAGGEIMGHYTLAENRHNEWSIWYTAQALHLFKAQQKRSFDTIKNGFGSKYLLVRDFGSKDINGYSHTMNHHLPLINISTLNTNVSVNLLLDAAATLVYKQGNWHIAGGYNLFGKTKEKVELSDTFDENRYAIMGQQPNLQASNNGGGSNVVQPEATINGPMTPSGTALNPAANPELKDVTTTHDYFIKANDFDVSSVSQPAGWSSKIFAECEYKNSDLHYCPYINVRAEVEFGHSDNNALHQWSIGLHTGIAL